MKAFLILLLAAAGGCVTRVETPGSSPQPSHRSPQQPAIQRQTVTDKRVIIGSSLEKALRIVGIKSTIGAGGFLRIQVDVQNLTDSSKQFSYRIDWFDREGAALPLAASPSISWMLLSRETSFLAATSPTPAAKDFRVTFLSLGDH
jgi:uncharacterized protein YcfL